MRPRRPYYLFAVFVLPALFALQKYQISDPVQIMALSVIKPLLVVGESASSALSRIGSTAFRFWDAVSQYDAMKQQVAVLESKVMQTQELERENVRLKKLLDFRDSLKVRSVSARVIGWDPSPWRKIVILDKGTRHGIQKDMAVIVVEGLIGRIFNAGPETSKAILLIDIDGRASALADNSRAQGAVGGDGTGTLSMRYLNLDSGAAVGETVITSGIGGVFPKGIRIGKIETISRDETGLHLTAAVRAFADFKKIEEVLCVASYPEG